MIYRSVLFVPTSNAKAMAKAPSLTADILLLDLEDALAPQQKNQGRAAAIRFLRKNADHPKPIFVRINQTYCPEQLADIRAIANESPAAIVVPKVNTVEDLAQVAAAIRNTLQGTQKPIPPLWAMIETPSGMINLASIAKTGRRFGLAGLIAGTNDLAQELRCATGSDRSGLDNHLTQIILHARAFGLIALDGVYNDFSDEDGFLKQANQGKALGFDGKTLIHPSQISAANIAFGPTIEQIKQAKAIIRAFSFKKNAGKGAIRLGDQMVERLHLSDAQRLLNQFEQQKEKK